MLSGRGGRGSTWGDFTRGAPEGIRTPNLLIRSQMLYPLSYGRLVPEDQVDTLPAAMAGSQNRAVKGSWRRRRDLNPRRALRPEPA